MNSMNSERFLREYDLNILKEFEIDGQQAQWAPGVSGPRSWGEEDDLIDLRDPNAAATEKSTAAFSPDEKFLAVAFDNLVKIYDLDTKGLRSERVAHESAIENLHFMVWTPEHTARALAGRDTGSRYHDVAYLLFAEGERCRSSEEGFIAVWPVDANGRLRDESPPLSIEHVATSAMRAMSADLASYSDVEDSELSMIRDGLVQTLRHVDVKRRQKRWTILEGRFPHFGTEPISRDGQKCLYISNGRSTQGGMRPADELPHIVVWDAVQQTEICRLKGHTDAIMWAGWGAGDQSIVTACWDSHFKIWDAQTGECRHSIGPTGNQNWAGTVSPDGEHVMLSGGPLLGVYMLGSGIKTANVDKSSQLQIRPTEWIRELSWSPQGNAIAVATAQKVFLIDPDTGASHDIVQLENDGTLLTRYASFRTPKWIDGGKKLVLRCSERTLFVWDREDNVKWRFQRPKGLPVKRYNQSVCYIARMKMLVSVDGDLKVRFWKL